MAKTNNSKSVDKLASYWSPPTQVAGSDKGPGDPLLCIASTYTFEARFLEDDLLPRFLGLRFDNTESERPFVVEREDRLGTARVCVLVDADHVDPNQTTLRWDQLPVHVPAGVQHSKVVVLLWERLARLIVSSANLSKRGYRRNREVASVLDFYNDAASAPRKIITDVMQFFRSITPGISAASGAIERFKEGAETTLRRIRGWGNMALDFTQRDWPKVYFVPGIPSAFTGKMRSPVDQVVEIWGDRPAHKICVLTPFVGTATDNTDPVISILLKINHRMCDGYLAVPGRQSQKDSETMVVNLPKRFRDAWASAWGIEPIELETYVVPPFREDEKIQRDLHAKAIFVTDHHRQLLLCGSSNFSAHGMGVGVVNVEPNLCYVDQCNDKRDEYLDFRLPVDWQRDRCDDPIWPDEPLPLDEDVPSHAAKIPPVFQWASYNQKEAKLTIGLDLKERLPAEWSIFLPGEKSADSPSLADQNRYPIVPDTGILEIQLPEIMKRASIACLRVNWTTPDGGNESGLLSVQVSKVEDLLPPDEFTSLRVDSIIACLVSGRDPAEWVEAQENQKPLLSQSSDAAVESLRAVDTSGYALYRIRLLGRALASLGERILKTVPTREAMTYRLVQDPLGPKSLIEALFKELESATQEQKHPRDFPEILFTLSEIALTVAHTGQKVHVGTETRGQDLRPLFRSVIASLFAKMGELESRDGKQLKKLSHYIGSVKAECHSLIGNSEAGEQNVS